VPLRNTVHSAMPTMPVRSRFGAPFPFFIFSSLTETHRSRVRHVTVSSLESVGLLSQCLQPSGGQVAIVNPTLRDKDLAKVGIPSNVSIRRVMVKTAHEPVTNGEFARKYYRLFGQWLEEGKLKGNKFRVVPGGLEGIDVGLNEMAEGKVRIVLVVTVTLVRWLTCFRGAPRSDLGRETCLPSNGNTGIRKAVKYFSAGCRRVCSRMWGRSQKLLGEVTIARKNGALPVRFAESGHNYCTADIAKEAKEHT
jgi:hypothetical protein